MSRDLSSEQRLALDAVRLAHAERVHARALAKAEAARMVERAVADAAVLESRAIRRAIAAGVSRRRIGLDGLGTSDYYSVTRALAVTEGEEAPRQITDRVHDGAARPVPAVELAALQPDEGVEIPPGVPVLRVDWPGAPSERLGTVDVHGYVFRDAGRWLMAADDTDSGELAIELRRNRPLTALLDQALETGPA